MTRTFYLPAIKTLKTTKLTWKKIASVSRRGRYFYYSPMNQGTAYWICQSFISGKWSVEDNHGAVWGRFDTAKQAIAAVETC